MTPDETIRQRWSFVLLLVLCAFSRASAIDWPLCYVESPVASHLPDGFRPVLIPAGSRIVRCIVRDERSTGGSVGVIPGTKTVLVDQGATGAVWDDMESLDAKWLFYAQIDDVAATNVTDRAKAGSDLWRLNLETGFRERLTHQEKADYFGHDRDAQFFGVFNSGPCPIADRVLFTSDREVADQHMIWTMDHDGKNVEKVNFSNVRSALHPFRLSNGRIGYSSHEEQGTRHNLNWGIHTTLPDGRDYAPFFSSYFPAIILHFAAEAGNKQVFTTAYYAQNNMGFGSIFGANLDFGTWEHRAPIPYQGLTEKLFLPKTTYNLTPTAPWNDGPSEHGKYTHPAPSPVANELLVSYSAGPVHLTGGVTTPAPNSGIYLLPIGQPSTGPEQLIKLVDEPQWHEWQPRALVAYPTVFPAPAFGSSPKEEPWLPNAGSDHLPAGTPYGLFGTSSLYVRETDALEIMGAQPHIGKTAERTDLIGGNRQPFDNSKIAKLRLLVQEGNPDHFGYNQKFRTAMQGDERLRIWGEVDVRRFDANGNRILDPGGNPDTSVLFKVIANVPFIPVLVDDEGRNLTVSKNWHVVPPGGKEWNCNGCHAHTAPETRFTFAQSWAASHPPVDLTAVQPRMVEFKRDVLPILDAKCNSCHGPAGSNPLNFAPHENTANSEYYRIAAFALWQAYESRYSKFYTKLTDNPDANHTVTPAEARTIAEWIDTGATVDRDGGAFEGNTKPTLFIHSPRRKTAPITQVVVSAAHFNLDKSSLLVTLNGQPLNMGNDVDGIWTASVPSIDHGELIAEVKDVRGNLTKLKRTFTAGTASEPLPAPPPSTLNAQIKAKVSELKVLTDMLP